MLSAVPQQGRRGRALQSLANSHLGFKLTRPRTFEFREFPNLHAAWNVLEDTIISLGQPNTRAILQLPRQEHRQRATAFLLHANASPPRNLWGVAKLALDEDAVLALRRETTVAEIDLDLSGGFHRPALLASNRESGVGVGVWSAVDPSQYHKADFGLRALTIKLKTSAHPNHEIFTNWTAEVSALAQRYAPSARAAAVIDDLIHSCSRKPIHGDFTESNIVAGTQIVDWENFHPAGPALTDEVSQLIDQARYGVRTKASLRRAAGLVRRLPKGDTILAAGYLAVHGDPLAELLFKQLLLVEKPQLVDLCELPVQRNTKTHAAIQNQN